MKKWLLTISPTVHHAGYDQRESDWVDPRRIIYNHELMCFGSDNPYRIEFEDKTYEMGEHSFIIIPPGQWHSCRAEAVHDIYRTWIHFDWTHQTQDPDAPLLTYSRIHPSLKNIHHAPESIPKTILHGKIKNPELLFKTHHRLCHLHEIGDLKSTLLARSLLLEILADLLAPDSPSTEPKTKKTSPDDIHKALQQVAEMPFSEAPLLKYWLSEQFGRSYDHLCRLFKQHYGTTPLQHINTLRIEHAKWLLVTSPKPVATIAHELGFSDPVYFHRLFKQLTGLPPGQFRKQQKE